jgi:hypothetical protein
VGAAAAARRPVRRAGPAPPTDPVEGHEPRAVTKSVGVMNRLAVTNSAAVGATNCVAIGVTNCVAP